LEDKENLDVFMKETANQRSLQSKRGEKLKQRKKLDYDVLYSDVGLDNLPEIDKLNDKFIELEEKIENQEFTKKIFLSDEQ